MTSIKRPWRWIAVLGVFGLIAAACGGGAETTTTTPSPTETTEAPPTATTEPPPTATGFTYKLGIISDPVTDNYWSRYDTTGNDVYTAYVLDITAPTLYTLTPPALSVTPNVAEGDIPAGEASGDGWVIDVPIRADATWSDGEAITADDVAFTFNIRKEFNLGGPWLDTFPLAAEGATGIVSVEAVDANTVRWTWNNQPGLALWHYGAAQGPILAEHFWGPFADEARAAGEAAEAAVSDPAQAAVDAEAARAEEAGEDPAFTADDITQDQIDAYMASVFSGEAAKQLEAVSGVGAPSGGGFAYAQREAGAFWRNESVPEYWESGFTYKVYDGGAVTIQDPSGTEITVSGEPSGAILAEYTVGPYAAEQLFQVYGTQDAAALALVNGDIDYWINPLTLSRGLLGQFQDQETLTINTNPSNSLFYFAFNMRKFPGNDLAYRQAVTCMVDKDFVANNVLAGQVLTVNSIIPPGNAFWANPNPVDPPCAGLDQVQRLEAAVQILKDAGWSWSTEPIAEARDVTAGVGLTGPDGQTLPQMTIYAPGPGYDPMRATYSLFIQNSMNDLGIPIVAEPTGFSTIVNIAFASNDWDAYILGWGLTLFPDYLESFFASGQDSILFGGSNTPGYNNPEFDALAEELLTATALEDAQAKAWEMDTMINTDLPYITLFTNITYDVYRNSIVFPFSQVLDGIQSQYGLPTVVAAS